MMRQDERGDLDVVVVVTMICVILAILAAGFAFLAYDSPQEHDGSMAGALAATVEQIGEST